MKIAYTVLASRPSRQNSLYNPERLPGQRPAPCIAGAGRAVVKENPLTTIYCSGLR